MFDSSLSSTIRYTWWPRGGMVDTMDLKSMPFWEYQFKSGRGYQYKGLEFFVITFVFLSYTCRILSYAYDKIQKN